MTDSNDAAFYDQRWSAAEVSAAKQIRARAILAAVEAQGRHDLKILELGCGTGWLCNELSRFGAVTGLDISPLAIDGARTKFPALRFVCADAGAWSPDDRYDIVVSHEVIEHLRDPERHVALAREALVSDGVFIITTPNAFAAYGMQAMIRNAYERQPLENWMYRDELTSLLTAGGFAIERSTTVVPTRGYRSRGLRFLASSRLDRLASRLHAGPRWNALKGSLGLHESLFVIARRDSSGATA